MVRADKLRLQLVQDGKLPDGIHDGLWLIEAAELTPFDEQRGQWFWLIRFEYSMSQPGPPNELLVVVLMDGTVIQPTMTKAE